MKKILSMLGVMLFGSFGLTACSSGLNPADFEVEITVGQYGSVLAGEDFEVTSSLVVPENFDEPLIMTLERREVGGGWTSIAENQVTDGRYSFESLDRLSEGVTAEYRLSASQPNDGSGPFIVSQPQRLESLGGEAFLGKFFVPSIKATFPESVSTDMLIPGDEIKFEWGFESRVPSREVTAKLVSTSRDESQIYKSESTTETSFTRTYSFVAGDNLLETSITYEFAVEVTLETPTGQATIVSDGVDFISHSIETTIANYLDATNQNCKIDGLTCIETLQEYGGEFVDNYSDAWFDIYSYYFEFDDYYFNGLDYQLRLSAGTLIPMERARVERCNDEPVSLVSDDKNRFFTFEVGSSFGEYRLLGRLYNDSSTYVFSFTPLECAIRI